MVQLTANAREIASVAGADYVKFQSFQADLLANCG